MIYDPAQLPALVDIAMRTAYARRGVAHLTVPTDIQVADADANPYEDVGPARPPATAPIRLAAPGLPVRGGPAARLADVLERRYQARHPGRRRGAARQGRGAGGGRGAGRADHQNAVRQGRRA